MCCSRGCWVGNNRASWGDPHSGRGPAWTSARLPPGPCRLRSHSGISPATTKTGRNKSRSLPQLCPHSMGDTGEEEGQACPPRPPPHPSSGSAPAAPSHVGQACPLEAAQRVDLLAELECVGRGGGPLPRAGRGARHSPPDGGPMSTAMASSSSTRPMALENF